MRKGDLPDVSLLGADYILYGVYQDWVHKKIGELLDGGIRKIVSGKHGGKTPLYADPTLQRTFQEIQEDICWNNLCRTWRSLC